MISLLALTMASALTAATADPASCPGDNTLQINQCFSDRLAAADAVLGRYQTAVRKLLRDEIKSATPGDTTAATAAKGFEAAEKAWAVYVKTECGAVYDHWSGGTIRAVKEISCDIQLTQLHTHAIWSLWLTYEDSTPPILPEPSMPSVE